MDEIDNLTKIANNDKESIINLLNEFVSSMENEESRNIVFSALDEWSNSTLTRETFIQNLKEKADSYVALDDASLFSSMFTLMVLIGRMSTSYLCAKSILLENHLSKEELEKLHINISNGTLWPEE